MSARSPVISARFAELLRDYLRSRKVDPGQVFQLEIARRSAGEEFVSLFDWIQALQRIAVFTQDPAVGLAIGAQIRPRHLGVAGYLMAHCSNTGEVLMRLMHFSRLAMNAQDWDIRIEGGNFVLSWPPGRLPLNQIWADLRSSAVVSFCRNVTGLQDQPVLRAEYALPPPDDLQPYLDFYRGEVVFQQPRFSLSIDVDLVTTPMIEPDPALVELLDEKAGRLLQEMSAQSEIDADLYQATMQSINAGRPGAEGVAARLNCSRRTLIRRLASYGKTFRQVQDECRLELARSYLVDRQLSLADISGLLGYHDQAAFTRAFKRWTGNTPSRYRQQLSGQAP